MTMGAAFAGDRVVKNDLIADPERLRHLGRVILHS